MSVFLFTLSKGLVANVCKSFVFDSSRLTVNRKNNEHILLGNYVLTSSYCLKFRQTKFHISIITDSCVMTNLIYRKFDQIFGNCNKPRLTFVQCPGTRVS